MGYAKAEHKAELEAFKQLLLKEGFTIIEPDDKTSSYFFFWKDGKMGYVQKGHFSGYDFSSELKPCQAYGTGFSILQNVDLSLENAYKTIKTGVPHWASPNDRKQVKHYSSPEEFVKGNNILKYTILYA